MLTVLILHNVESVYFFYSNPVFSVFDRYARVHIINFLKEPLIKFYNLITARNMEHIQQKKCHLFIS